MKMPEKLTPDMLAPCGVLCAACSAYLSAKTPCPGCRAPAEAQKRKSCQNCAKRRCADEKGYRWCFECEKFPCARIRDLSRRYVQNYAVDLVQNGHDAKADMEAFLAGQRARFTCAACGGAVDQHHQKCSQCGAAYP